MIEHEMNAETAAWELAELLTTKGQGDQECWTVYFNTEDVVAPDATPWTVEVKTYQDAQAKVLLAAVEWRYYSGDTLLTALGSALCDLAPARFAYRIGVGFVLLLDEMAGTDQAS